jgi:hypothetical protein
VQGGRGVASRLGHATTGLRVLAKGWHGDVIVYLSVKDGSDWCRIIFNGHKELYDGPLNEYRDPRGVRIPLDVNHTLLGKKEDQ